MATVVSLNVGTPREVAWHDTVVTTGIFKAPVAGRVPMRRTNLDGDRQADLSVHGGLSKAVYCYPHEHYSWWEQQLGRSLPLAVFGENLTTEGLDESSVHVGDQFTIGSAEVVVTQPRMPCYKLGIRFESDDMVKRFLASGRSGFYLAVISEGEVGAGDVIVRTAEDPRALPISAMNRLYVAKTFNTEDAAIVQRALEIDALPDGWKEHFRRSLAAR